MQTWSQIHVSDNVVSTWRHRDTPCPYPNGDTHGDMETLHVYIHMETQRCSMSKSTWRHGDTPCPYPHDVETWRHSMSISTLSPLVYLLVHLSTHLLFILFKIQLDHSTSVIWLHVSDNIQT